MMRRRFDAPLTDREIRTGLRAIAAIRAGRGDDIVAELEAPPLPIDDQVRDDDAG